MIHAMLCHEWNILLNQCSHGALFENIITEWNADADKMLLLLMEIKSNLLQSASSWRGQDQSCIQTTLAAKSPKVRSNELGAHSSISGGAKTSSSPFFSASSQKKIDASGHFRNIVCHIFLSCSFAKLQKVFVVLNYKPDRNKTLLLSRNFADIGAPSFVC